MRKLVIKLFIFSLLLIHVVAVFTITAIKPPRDISRSNRSFSDETHPFESNTGIELDNTLPIVINTWPFIEAGFKAWDILSQGGSALDAVEQGCSTCEQMQCDGTVGFGGSPDENGETTLDALIMDGETHKVGAVGSLRRVKDAISVARRVLENTEHTLLVGSQATEFAIMMGFPEEDLTTTKSDTIFKLWKKNKCQPNFWKDVQPNPRNSCGPYKPVKKEVNETLDITEGKPLFGTHNHDTIGMIAIDSLGRIAAGTSTNGAIHKIPGRVGDSPIPGSGAYVDKEVGGAAATGDGDVMMRFMPSLIAVERMREGLSPLESAVASLQRITRYEPEFSGAVVTLSIKGEFGAACNNLPDGVFNYTVGNSIEGVNLQFVTCLDVITFKEISVTE